MVAIEINGIKEIRERIDETEVGQFDIEDSKYLSLKTKTRVHFFLKRKSSFSGNIEVKDSVMYAEFQLINCNKLNGRSVYYKMVNRNIEDLYWEIYDEVMNDLGMK